MIGKYLKAALTRITSDKLYSLISISSLAVGFMAATLIATFIAYESGFDAMHPASERTYRLNWVDENAGSRFATFFNIMSPLLDEGLDEIEGFTRLARREHLFTVNGVKQYATLSMVDGSFFDFFSYPAIAGDPATAILDKESAVLTQAAAQRLFGSIDAVGRVFTVNGDHDFRVAAIVADNPANSHLGSNIFANIENLPDVWKDSRIWSNTFSDLMYHYVRLQPGADAATVADSGQRYLVDNLNVPDMGWRIMLQGLRDIHFTTDLQNEMSPTDDMLGTVKSLRQRSDITVFATIAMLILLIASLNFMNMCAVRFSRQTREIGVRRAAGSSRAELVLHLLGESIVLALVALVLSFTLCEVLLPYFGKALGATLPDDMLRAPVAIGLQLLIALGIGVATGLYPASQAARLPLARVLRGEFSTGKSTAQVRSLLIVLQFTISICLIAGAFVVKRQLDYAHDIPLGFNPANVVRVELPNAEARRAYPALSTELARTAGVVAVSAGSTIPTGDLSDGMVLIPADGNEDEQLAARLVGVRDGYFNALGMQVLAGRALSEDFATDIVPVFSPQQPRSEGSVVLSRSAARKAGWNDPAQAIGKRFYFTDTAGDVSLRVDLTVVGVVEDAHFGSIRREVEPITYIFFEGYRPNVMTVRLNPDEFTEALDALEGSWNRLVPDYPIRYSFLDVTYNALYAGETRTFALFIALSVLAILIACSGLYGLALWVTERRTKEIGVRKVMGGTVWQIVVLLTNDFSKLVLFANVLAWPLAWYAMERWLENFAYRIDLTPVIFIGSGLIALCIAWVTVGSTAAKAANRKPVLALRYE